MKRPHVAARAGYRLIKCDGEAHSNPHIDNCSRCAPRWGLMMRLSPEGIHQIAQGERKGGASSVRELARALDDVLSILWPGGGPSGRDVSPEGLANVIAEIAVALGDYAPDAGVEP